MMDSLIYSGESILNHGRLWTATQEAYSERKGIMYTLAGAANPYAAVKPSTTTAISKLGLYPIRNLFTSITGANTYSWRNNDGSPSTILNAGLGPYSGGGIYRYKTLNAFDGYYVPKNRHGISSETAKLWTNCAYTWYCGMKYLTIYPYGYLASSPPAEATKTIVGVATTQIVNGSMGYYQEYDYINHMYRYIYCGAKVHFLPIGSADVMHDLHYTNRQISISGCNIVGVEVAIFASKPTQAQNTPTTIHISESVTGASIDIDVDWNAVATYGSTYTRRLMFSTPLLSTTSIDLCAEWLDYVPASLKLNQSITATATVLIVDVSTKLTHVTPA